jgi:hypothetical protein
MISPSCCLQTLRPFHLLQTPASSTCCFHRRSHPSVNLGAFRDHIRSIKAPTDLAAARSFRCLVIGGGAAARRRTKALCGDAVLNLFEKVSGPGREKRKAEFIAFFYSLAAPAPPTFNKITAATALCMEKEQSHVAQYQCESLVAQMGGVRRCGYSGSRAGLMVGSAHEGEGEDSNWSSGLLSFLSPKPPHSLAM